MYAVIFTAKINDLDNRYSETAEPMRDLAFAKDNCLEFNAVTEGNTEIAISYWQDLNDIQRWKQDASHLEAQLLGKQKWYNWYKVEIAKIERRYEFP